MQGNGAERGRDPHKAAAGSGRDTHKAAAGSGSHISFTTTSMRKTGGT